MKNRLKYQCVFTILSFVKRANRWACFARTDVRTFDEQIDMSMKRRAKRGAGMRIPVRVSGVPKARRNPRLNIVWWCKTCMCVAIFLILMGLTGCSQGDVSVASTEASVSSQSPAQEDVGMPGAGMFPGNADGAMMPFGGGEAPDFPEEEPLAAQYLQEDLDASFTEEEATLIKGDGEDIFISGAGAELLEGNLLIRSAGTYILKGTFNGQVRIEAGKEALVRLVLDGARIENPSGSGIFGKQCKKLVLILADGSENEVRDGEEDRAQEEDETDAAVFCEQDLTLTGSGRLLVEGNYKNAVCTKDVLKVTGGTYTLSSVRDALKGKDGVMIKDASLSIYSGKDGIKSSKEEDPEKGYVIIDGGEIAIEAGDDAIHAESWLCVYGGEIEIEKCYEGLEGLKVVVSGGEISVHAQDDAVNAAGAVADGMAGEWQKMQTNEEAYVWITGGTLYLDAAADGIDSNGHLFMEGGEVYITGPQNMIEAAIDCNGSALIRGGTVVAASNSFMMPGFHTDSEQPQLLVSCSESQEAASEIFLKDSDGKILAQYAPVRAYSAILVSSEALIPGETYTLEAGKESYEITAGEGITRVGTQNQPQGMMGGPAGFGQGMPDGQIPDDMQMQGMPGGEQASDGTQMQSMPGAAQMPGMPGGMQMPEGEMSGGEMPGAGMTLP